MAINIDWKKVENALMAGANGTEICAFLGISFDTLARKVEKEYNLPFADFKAAKRAKGNSLLRVKQFDTALTGSVPMQIWLGKNRLGQTDKKEIISENKNINSFDLSSLTDEQLEQLASLTAIIQPDTSGTSQEEIS